MTLTEQLEQVLTAIEEEKGKGEDTSVEVIKSLESQASLLQEQIAIQGLEAERVQAQEQKVESITLPHDFNKLFEDPRANDIIIELIKSDRRKAYTEHNEEILNIITAHKQDQEATKQQIAEFQNKADADAKELLNAHQTIYKLNFELEDACSKRDAAVRQAEGLETLVSEKQEHIDKLRDEIAVGAKAAINVTAIGSSDRLEELVQESKSAKVKSSLELALERTAPVRGVVEIQKPVAKELQFQDQTITPSSVEVPDVGSQFPVIPTAEVPTVPAPMAEGSPSQIGQGQTVEERLSALEAHVFGYVKIAS